MWTRKAVAALALATVCSLIGLATASSTLIILSGILLITLAVVASQDLYPSLSIDRRMTRERFSEGEDIEIEIIVKNRDTSPVAVTIADELPALLRVKTGSNHVPMILAPGGSATHAYLAQAPVKGAYTIELVKARVEDALGFYQQEHDFMRPARLTVLPASQDLRRVPAKTKLPLIFLGSQTVRAPGQGMEFFGLREYAPGDPLKEVNWKASARSTGLVVNQREKETLAEVTVFVDSRERMGDGTLDDNPALWASRAAASLCEFFIDRRDRVRLVCYGYNIHILEADGGRRQIHKILDQLTTLSPSGDLLFAAAVERVLPRLRRNSPIVLISSLVGDPSLVRACQLLASRSMHTLVIGVEPKSHSPDAKVRDLTTLARTLTLQELRSSGVAVVTWPGNHVLAAHLVEVHA